MLQDKSILIIEDNILLALDLANVVEDYGGRVVGPATTAAEAIRLLRTERIGAAVVACQLADDDVTQVVRLLAEQAIPVVINTVTTPPSFVLRTFPNAPLFRGPVQSKMVVAKLLEEVGNKDTVG